MRRGGGKFSFLLNPVLENGDGDKSRTTQKLVNHCSQYLSLLTYCNRKLHVYPHFKENLESNMILKICQCSPILHPVPYFANILQLQATCKLPFFGKLSVKYEPQYLSLHSHCPQQYLNLLTYYKFLLYVNSLF